MFEIKDFKPRLYQENITHTSLTKNTLVVLPTGLGKTSIAMMLASNRLNNFRNSKVLFLAPSKPLVAQHMKTFKKHIDARMNIFTGEVKPELRKELYKENEIIFSTPQTVANDITGKRINLKDFSLLVLDEVHKCVGNYDYVFIAKEFMKNSQYPRILGLTASPGSDKAKIEEIRKNAFIEEIEIRSNDDVDVKPYVQEVKIDWIKIDLPSKFLDVKKFLDNSLKERLKKLKGWGLIGSSQDNVGKGQLLDLQARIHGKIARGEKDIRLWEGISLTAQCVKISHAIELLESQGVSILYKYLKGIFEASEKTNVKSAKNLVKDINFKSAYVQCKNLYEESIEHPKLDELKKIISSEITNDKIKIMVFTQYRDSAKLIEKELEKIGVKGKIFVGQQKKEGSGMSQKEQITLVEDFKKNKFSVLISTNIGEEGLDIPEVDLVVFYEPIPSGIRYIQRKGRTGRQSKGKIVILMARNTRDEAYHWTAFNKEKKMYNLLKKINEKILLEKQPTLESFSNNDKLKVIVDHRERGIVNELKELELDVELKYLKAGDFVLSDKVGIELKTKEDFVNSIIDGRLLNQLKLLRENFEIPLLIIQGDEDIYSMRNVHPNAIRGMLSTIAVSYNIPVLHSQNAKDTAGILKIIAKREQDPNLKNFYLRNERKPLTLKEQQEYIIQSLPGIGPNLSKSLLANFKSVREIFNADTEKLREVDKIGKKKADNIKKVIDENYFG
ncbi:DEAD/DEAH box helicase family protein [Candidatus Woesearchaeota archaeon]|nr:DEAD/DEAH box helicase family protein [Candidatus Woesearchaeota archaeon]